MYLLVQQYHLIVLECLCDSLSAPTVRLVCTRFVASPTFPNTSAVVRARATPVKTVHCRLQSSNPSYQGRHPKRRKGCDAELRTNTRLSAARKRGGLRGAAGRAYTGSAATTTGLWRYACAGRSGEALSRELTYLLSPSGISVYSSSGAESMDYSYAYANSSPGCLEPIATANHGWI